MKTRQIIKNMLYAFTAQGISLLMSLTVSLIIPKFLGVTEYSYWQLFLFYASYLGFFHFGLNDGLYLRKGGEQYEQLDFDSVGTQLKVAFGFHCLVAVAIIVASLMLEADGNRRFIWICVALYLPVYNAVAFFNVLFQAVNRIKLYSIVFSIDKAFIILSVIILLLAGYRSFTWYILAYVAGLALTLLYCTWRAREIICSRLMPLHRILPEIRANIACGIKLMLSNIASILIVGIGRFIVDQIWGIAAFGKFSLAIAISSIFLLFINQLGNVLFPALKNTNEQNMKKFYDFSRELIGLLFAAVFLAYMPIKYLLGLWLPQYGESLPYLALLLPLCTYDGKMNMLCMTYFKVLRKEKQLLQINILSIAVSLVLSLIGGYWLKDIYCVVLAMVVVVAFRSIIAEILLARLMGASVTKNLIADFLLAAIFMTCTWFISPVGGFLAYAAVFALYLVVNRSVLQRLSASIRGYMANS